MSSLSPQHPRRHAARIARFGLRIATLGCVALGLGGCLSRSAEVDTTGSIGGARSETVSRTAVEALGQAFDRNPADAGTAVAYSRALKGIGQHAQAVAVLQQAAIRNSHDLALLAAYGKALAEAGRLKEASSVLARAHTPERPDWRILSAQGAVADQMGDHEGAQRYYEAALRLAPGEPSVLSNQGLSFALAKRLPQAESVLRQAVANPAADMRVRQNLALVLGLEGKLAEAESVLKRDLGSTDAAASTAALRGMVSQTNSWSALKQADAGRSAAKPPAKLALGAEPAAPAPQPRTATAKLAPID